MNRISLRERKKHETRENLIRAAISLAVERGVAKVRVEDIAAMANVSPRTFNNYFSSKEAAILDVAFQLGVRISHSIAHAAPELNTDEVFRSAIISEFPEVPRKDWLSQLVLMYNDPDLIVERRRIDGQIELMAARAIAQRENIDEMRDIYPRLAAAAMIATVHVAIQHWLTSEAETGFRETLQDVLDLVKVARP
ncbi:TetR/AcrR family transcriptional regulator [Brucella pseudogrignonensis]|uniref:AcrR family transcriptional regulator n=1 Tax=Brucella pseudogrignonensis TaxID=419475 RepID=A0ABU1MFB2_9HYPH|nr:TetR/AcrR family transcriptional regulator [Brucella pseudogrignonensis]MDR6434755.1 AcrR family transcriptional regulator [Brucella pseudogrignonensis]